MKKVLIATSVAFLAFATVASAQGYMFNSNLTVGSTGPDVVALQDRLIAAGNSIPAIASGAAAKGYFGSQTRAAVMAYQAARGIPSTGFVGPLTRGALNGSPVVTNPGTIVCPVGYNCVPVGGSPSIPSTPSTGGLSGTDGLISDVDELSQYANEEVGDGQNDVKVLGMDVEASSDGDIRIKSIKVSFDATGNTGSDNIDDYIESVSIWMGSTKVGSADASDFNEDSSDVWSKTVTVSGNAVVKADSTEKFYVAVDSVSNLDSGDISGDSWTVNVESIRFEDGSGVTTSDTTTGDLPDLDVPISFVSFSTAADTELKFSTDSSNPDGTIVVVDDNDTTEDVVLLIGKMELEGTSDAVLDELPITFTVGGTATGLASTTATVTLKIDGEEYTESITSAFNTAASSVTFDNLDLDIEAGKTLTFTVLAEILSMDGALTAGDVLKATFTASNRDTIDIENEEGDQLSSGERTGSATGEFMEFRTEGIGLTLVSTAKTPADNAVANNDLGEFKIVFDVIAIGDTVYVSSLADATLSGVTTGKASINVDRAGTATVGGVTASIENTEDSTLNSAGLYEIPEGTTERFELTTTVQLPAAGSAGTYRAQLGGISWGTDATDATPNNAYTSDLDSFRVSGALN